MKEFIELITLVNVAKICGLTAALTFSYFFTKKLTEGIIYAIGELNED
jgi:hypothetical protein